jgi:hypothetical protein
MDNFSTRHPSYPIGVWPEVPPEVKARFGDNYTVIRLDLLPPELRAFYESFEQEGLAFRF